MTQITPNRQSAVTFCAITDKGHTAYLCISKAQYKRIKRRGNVTITNIGKASYKANYRSNFTQQ